MNKEDRVDDFNAIGQNKYTQEKYTSLIDMPCELEWQIINNY